MIFTSKSSQLKKNGSLKDCETKMTKITFNYVSKNFFYINQLFSIKLESSLSSFMKHLLFCVTFEVRMRYLNSC